MNTKSVRIILVLLGIFHVLNGLTMLAAPTYWYDSVPGVTATGPINSHFIADIGLAFIASGIGLSMAIRDGATAATLALAGAVWPSLHALMHVWEWISHSLPASSQELVSTGLGVIVLSFVGLWLAWIWVRREGVMT